MPAKSKKQEKFMRAVAHSPKFAKKVGVPQSVGREFTKGDDMKYGKAEGGMMKKMGRGMAKADMQEKAMKKGGEAHSDIAKDKPMMKKVASAAVKGHEKRMHKKGGTTKMAKGGCATKKMAKGGSYRSSCDGIAKRGKTRAK